MRWSVSYFLVYSLEELESPPSGRIGNRGLLQFVSGCKCWAIQAEVAEDRQRGVRFSLRYTLLGLGDDTATPFSSSGGIGSRDLRQR
jgi:hypothetical protein